MYIYNVTVKITSTIKDKWIAWMQETHMPEVLATGMFSDARLSELLEPTAADDDGLTYVAQYFTDSFENYNTYIDEHAPILRQKGFDEFGNQFIAFRSLLKNIVS
jgi:pantothenate kinase